MPVSKKNNSAKVSKSITKSTTKSIINYLQSDKIKEKINKSKNKKSNISFTIINDIGFVVFDAPNSKVNVLTSATLLELDKILNKIESSITTRKKSLQAIVFQSNKKKNFIAGADINEIKAIKTEEDALKKVQAGQNILKKIKDLPLLTIAVIEGTCLGGGLELALSCDIRVATDEDYVKLGLPEVSLGIIPGFGGTQYLPRIVGAIESIKLITSGKIISSKYAYRINLVDLSVPQSYLSLYFLDYLQELILNHKKIIKRRSKKTKKALLTYSVIFTRAKQLILQKTNGHYPAPLQALRLLRKTLYIPLNKGLAMEAKIFAKLAAKDTDKNLINLFFINEAIKKDSGGKNVILKKEMQINSAGVLGAGIMGGGIAWAFSNIGINTKISDINWSSLQSGLLQVKRNFKDQIKRKKFTPSETKIKMDKIAFGLDQKGFKHKDIIVEAIIEDINIKKKSFKEVEKTISPNTIIASNTSALSITNMAKGLQNPERFLGMHFFNPVNRMPLVEVIPHPKTSPMAITQVLDLVKRMNKVPIVVKDCSGFLVNRILMPYINEAGYLLEDGCSILNIDKAFLKFGLPIGPLKLLDTVGIDIGFKVSQSLEQAYGYRAKPNKIFCSLYEKKLFGVKNKKGVYLYKGKNKIRENREIYSILQKENDLYKLRRYQIEEEMILERCLYMMLNEATFCLQEKILKNPSYLDMALVLGMGFPAFRGGILRYADKVGIQNIVKKLQYFTDRWGKRFTPSPLLSKMAKKNETFYKD